MANPVEKLEEALAKMQQCVFCDAPIHDSDRSKGRCPTCNTKLSFRVALRESTRDVASFLESIDRKACQFETIPVGVGDFRREQEDQLHEEEEDLEYEPDGQDDDEDDDEDDDDGDDSTVGIACDRAAAGVPRSVRCTGKHKTYKQGISKQTGKFTHYTIKKRAVAPTKPGGRSRHQVCGMEPVKVKMNDQRMQKIQTLMAKHNNFATEADLNDPRAMVDHFTCLQILDEANTTNSHGKGSRYPRYMRDYVGPGKFFLYHCEITRWKQEAAHEFIENWIRTEKIKTQNIKGRPALNATPKALEVKIQKLLSDHKHGIDDYLDALDKLRAGEIKFPEPKSSFDSHPPPFGSGGARSTSLGRHVLADPDSPSINMQGMDVNDDGGEEAAGAHAPVGQEGGDDEPLEYAEEEGGEEASN